MCSEYDGSDERMERFNCCSVGVGGVKFGNLCFARASPCARCGRSSWEYSTASLTPATSLVSIGTLPCSSSEAACREAAARITVPAGVVQFRSCSSSDEGDFEDARRCTGALAVVMRPRPYDFGARQENAASMREGRTKTTVFPFTMEEESDGRAERNGVV